MWMPPPPVRSTAPPRRLTPKAQATRSRLVALAAEAFAEEGYAGASVRDLASRSGLTSGAIYGTFRGKAELLAEAVDASIAADLETLPGAVLAGPLPAIDAYQFATLDDPARARLRALLLEAAVAARSDRPLRDRLRDTVNGRLDDWTAAHDAWRAAQGIDPAVDMRALVVLLVSADLGLGVLGALGAELPDPESFAALIAALLASLERGHERDGASSGGAPTWP